MKPISERLLEQTEMIPDGCWVWMGGLSEKGYGLIYENGRAERTHRVSWKLKYDDIPKGLYVLHRCDNPCCINPNHLFLGTAKDNIRDGMNKGRITFRETHGRAKLKNADISKIRSDNRRPYSIIAKEYGVHKNTIGNIKNNRTWKGL